MGLTYVALLTVLTVLSVASIVALRAAAPWTTAAWAFTIAYDCTATWEIVAREHLPLHVPYACLVAMTLAFVVAGVRDEPQATPWWWPARPGRTRAEAAASVEARRG